MTELMAIHIAVGEAMSRYLEQVVFESDSVISITGIGSISQSVEETLVPSLKSFVR